jgi:hypothetical protein
MPTHNSSWPLWRRIVAYALYALAAAAAIELVDVKVHHPGGGRRIQLDRTSNNCFRSVF